jgi:hypothetical protein
VVNLATSNDEFNKLIDYIESKLFEQDNKKLEAQWWGECEKRISKHVDNKMRDFDAIVAPKVERRKWGWHPLFHIFTTIPSLWAFAPIFPWTHNNNEAMTIGDRIYNMERVGMFYLVLWCARFLKFYTLSRRINIPLIHPLHGSTKKNYKQWLSTRLNSKQW